jgi:uncharacterized membrane protein
LDNAIITLSNGMVTLTDDTGSYSLTNVTAGNYEMTVTKMGYETKAFNVTVEGGKTFILSDQTLQASIGQTISPNNDIRVQVTIAVMAIVAILVGAFLWRRRPSSP